MQPTGLIKKVCVVMALTVFETALAQPDCVTVKFRTVEFSKIQKSEARVCFKKRPTGFISQSCNQKKCEASVRMAAGLPVDEDTLDGPIGTPSAKLCRHLKGTFEIMEIQIGKAWKLTDRCVFGDGSFVSGSNLVRLNREALLATRALQYESDSLFDAK